MTTVIAILIVIGGVILAHELGHFIFAKISGIRVEEFSLGFPPKLLSKKIGETEYRISLIPLGGYVKVSGMIDESMDTEIKGEPWEFQSKNILQKLLFITGGVASNLLFAVLIFTILTLLMGIYKASTEPVVESVVPNFPADSAGIKKGDRILSINGVKISTWDEMTNLIHSHPNDSITVSWEADGITYEKRLLTVPNKILKDNRIVEVGMIGISPILYHRKATLHESILRGFSNTWYWLKVTVISLKMLITGQESLKSIGGPIFIAQLAGETAKSGIGSLFALMAIISVNLALINILPIPALDGGHFVITIIEGVKRKPLSVKSKVRIQQLGFAIVFALLILVLYNDILRIFGEF